MQGNSHPPSSSYQPSTPKGDKNRLTPRRYVSDRPEGNKENERASDINRGKTSRHYEYEQLAYSPLHLKKDYRYVDSKKFAYLEQQRSPLPMVVALSEADLLKRVRELQYQLETQQSKYKQLEERTIQGQTDMLNQLTGFEEKYDRIRQEKKQQEEQLRQLRNANSVPSEQSLVCEYKKIKGFASALIDMRRKVTNQDGDLKEAWKWIKTVVAEHQTTKQHAWRWKQAYEELHGPDELQLTLSEDSY